LSGTCLQALGAAWHAGCWTCAACGKPLEGTFLERGGQPYHQACYDERFGLRCSLCRELIRGKYFEHEGKPVCEKDFQDKLAPRCFYCGCVLEGTFTRNALGQAACARHQKGPRCASCERWLEAEEQQLPTGLYGTSLCRGCRVEAVGADALGTYGLAFASRVLQEVGLTLEGLAALPLRLASAANLRALRGPYESWADGITQTQVSSLNGREASRTLQGIVIVGGLAREHFEGVLAHELGHVWLFQAKLDQVPAKVVEGFCELVRHAWLGRLGTPLAGSLRRRLEESTDPVYGDGFRMVKQQWDANRTLGVMEALGRPPL
jgi:hypothetical protein